MSMISTHERARQLAETYVQSRAHNVSGGLSILDECTVKTLYGWIFFYDSTRYLQTRRIEDAIAGNGPLVVLRDGSIHSLGTAYPFEMALAHFEEKHATMLRALAGAEGE